MIDTAACSIYEGRSSRKRSKTSHSTDVTAKSKITMQVWAKALKECTTLLQVKVKPSNLGEEIWIR